MMRPLTIHSMVLVLILISGGAAQALGDTRGSLKAYLDLVMSTIKTEGLNSERVDWAAIDARVARLVETATGYSDTYPLIREVLTQMGERHSFLLNPDRIGGQDEVWYGFDQDQDGRVSYVDPQSMAYQKGLRQGDLISYVIPSERGRATVTWRRPPVPATRQTDVTSSTRPLWFPPQGDVRPGGVARLTLYPISVLSAKTSGLKAYATQGQQVLARLQPAASCGWIVDLRYNLGGTSFAMSTAVGPLLDPGARMYFKSKSAMTAVMYQDGQELRTDGAGLPQPIAGFRVEQPTLLSGDLKPVAVLQGPLTASSGEATALLFKGRPKTRFFGGNTAGLTTGNAPLSLPDGATLVLTTSRMLDRTQTFYPVLHPDEVVSPATDALTGTDLVLKRAETWLKEQCARSD